MRWSAMPESAAWRHVGTRAGFEVTFFSAVPRGHLLRGHTCADDEGSAWAVGYAITVDEKWRTVEVNASTSTAAGERVLQLTRDGARGWTVDGQPRPDLEGCVDVDFESSAMTNTLPVHRLELVEGTTVDVPAAFVRAHDLGVQRVEQRYTVLRSSLHGRVFSYESPTFDFSCELVFDDAGLIREYPGIATRHR